MKLKPGVPLGGFGSYKERPITEYEFEKRMDKRLEREALAPTKDPLQAKETLCPICKEYTAQTVMCPSHILGTYHPEFKFSKPFIVTCVDCKERMTRMENLVRDSL
jgi:hypothetical protein